MTDPNLAENPSVSKSQRYLIALPTGTEGPYTVEELREHLRTRRLDPSDHVLCEGDKKSRLLSDIIPEAASLQVRTDRVVRRKSTDGEGHAPEVSPRRNPATESQIRRYRTPLPVAAVPVDSGAPHQAEQVAKAPTPQKSGRVVLLVVALCCCLSVIMWQMGMFDSFGGGQQGLRWRVTFQGGVGGPWTLILNERDLTTTSPTNQVVHSNVHQSFEDGGRMRLQMDPPHPQLGAYITISASNPVEVVVEQDKGSGEALH